VPPLLRTKYVTHIYFALNHVSGAPGLFLRRYGVINDDLILKEYGNFSSEQDDVSEIQQACGRACALVKGRSLPRHPSATFLDF
jgi:hypothetical protein